MRLIDVDLLEKQMDKESTHLFNSMHKGCRQILNL